MISETEKHKCTGCGACMNICPNNSIRMQVDKEGFLYPHINAELCVGCDLCEKVCPVINVLREPLEKIPEALLAWSNNDIEVKNATSGGLFYAIAADFIRKGGCVVGAAYYDVYKVRHVVIDSVSDLPKICRSKYVQSEIGEVFLVVEQLLNEGKKVLFSGTGCQVYGLLSFLKWKKVPTEHLFTVDVVCHGVPSPMVLERYIRFMENTYHSSVVELRMREKKQTVPYKTDTFIVLHFEDGSHYQEYSGVDYFGRFFWGEMASRPSCYQCAFKTVGKISDMTIGDCWFSRALSEDSSVPYDVTLSLVHTVKGEKLMGSSRICSRCVDSEKAIKANGGMIYKSVVPNSNREEFFNAIQKEDAPIDLLAEKYFPMQSSRLNVLLRIKRILKKQAEKKVPSIAEILFFYERKKEFARRCSQTIPSAAYQNTVLK